MKDKTLEAILILARDLALENLGDTNKGRIAHTLMVLIHDTYPEIADRYTNSLIEARTSRWKAALRQRTERLRLSRLGIGPLVRGKE